MRLHKDAKLALIRGIPLFAECTDAEIASVASVADEIDFEPGRQLTKESARGQEFVVIVEGSAEVRQGDEVINRLGAGDFVGEIALVTGQPRTATVVATTPVHALVIEGHAFQRIIAETPQIKAKVERAAFDRLRKNTESTEA
jgi:CRP/FNR family transcriptional regulator, cyclic AMP receptor protein